MRYLIIIIFILFSFNSFSSGDHKHDHEHEEKKVMKKKPNLSADNNKETGKEYILTSLAENEKGTYSNFYHVKGIDEDNFLSVNLSPQDVIMNFDLVEVLVNKID